MINSNHQSYVAARAASVAIVSEPITRKAEERLINTIRVGRIEAGITTVACLIRKSSMSRELIRNFQDRSGAGWAASTVYGAEGRLNSENFLSALVGWLGIGDLSFPFLEGLENLQRSPPWLFCNHLPPVNRLAVVAHYSNRTLDGMNTISPILARHAEMLCYVKSFDLAMSKMYSLVGQRINMTMAGDSLIFYIEYDIHNTANLDPDMTVQCKHLDPIGQICHSDSVMSSAALAECGRDPASAFTETDERDRLTSDGFISPKKSPTVFFGTPKNTKPTRMKAVAIKDHLAASGYGEAPVAAGGADLEISPRKSRSFVLRHQSAQKPGAINYSSEGNF